MDVIKPQLVWVGKRCYRVNSVGGETHSEQKTTTNEYVEDDLYGDEQDCEGEDEFEIVEASAGRYKTSFHVPPAFFGAIIGAKGSVKKRIEGDTKTEITIPRHGSTDDIKIQGTKRDAVALSRRRIETIVKNCRIKQPPTHFNCVRITEPAIKQNYANFMNGIIKGGPTLGLQDNMFTHPDKLHFTIGMSCLMDDVDRSFAGDLLKNCLESIVLPIKAKYQQVTVSVRGVEIMNDDPSSVRILYAKVQSDALQEIADAIVKRFIDAGLSKREFGRGTVKLHMTLAKTNNAEQDRQKFRNKTFDARNILEKYADYDFGSQTVHGIHLAVRRSKDEDGFYKTTTTIQF